MSVPFISRTLRSFLRIRYPTAALTERMSKLSFTTSTWLQVEDNSAKYKRPVQPFLRFRSEFIAKVKKENPDLKLPELNQLISGEWADLDLEVKAEYRRAYEEEMEEFKAPFKKMPRKPAGVFARFVKENFDSVKSQNPGISTTEVIQKLGEKWGETPQEDKDILKQKIMEDTKQYELDVVAFEDSLSEEELDILNHLAKDRMKKLHQQKLKLLNFPKKPAGPFILFINMEKESFPRRENESRKEWLKRMGEKWREMSDEEKEMYIFVKKRAMEKYEVDVENWNLQHQTKSQ